MVRSGVPRVLGTLVAMLLGALPLGIVAALYAMPPIRPADSGVPWLGISLALALTLTASIAALAALVTGLRHGSRAALLGSGASAAVAGGAIAFVAGAESMAVPLLTAASFGAAALILADRPIQGRSARIAVAVAIMFAAEAAALVALLPATAAALEPQLSPILGAAIALGLVGLASSGGRRVAASALFIAGSGALIADRGGSFEAMIGLACLVAGQLLTVAAALDPVAAAAADEDEERLPDLAQRLNDAVLRFDGHLQLREWNPAAAQLLGLDVGSMGVRIEDLLGVSVAGLPGPEGTSVSNGAVGGLEIAMHRSGTGLTAVVRDPGFVPESERLGRELRSTIEELLRARRTIELQRAEIERGSTVDSLTGVGSRVAILERLRIEVAQARRYRHPLAVVLLDIDDFSELNRVHGIEGGDTLLREVALRIRLRIREADALGRAGSDGFMAALPHTDEGGAATFADALRHRLAQRAVTIEGEPVSVTISAGVAIMRPGEDLDLDGLVARVQEALDSARRAGGNRIGLDRLHGLARLEERRGDDPPAAEEVTQPGGA